MERKQLKEINNELATFLHDNSIKELNIKKIGDHFNVSLSTIEENWTVKFI